MSKTLIKSTDVDFEVQVTDKVRKLARQVKESLFKVAELYVEACKMYVNILSTEPTIKDAMQEEGFTAIELKKMEHIGRGLMHQKLLFASGRQYQALARCPLSDQEKCFNNPIPVLCANGDVLNVSIENLTKEQVDQVFSNGTVRSIAGQKNYLESLKTQGEVEKAKESTAQKPAPYKVTKYGIEKITVTSISRAELLAILNKLP